MSNVLSKMPNIAIPRSRFRQPFNHSTSFEHGKLIPLDCFEILPGDNYSLTLSSLIRMSTPYAPIMGNIECYLHAFFVPMRLIWDDAEKFYGDPSNHGKVQSIVPVAVDSVKVPNWFPEVVSNSSTLFCKSVASYLGKPFVTDGDLDPDVNFISCLKERGYYVIWNEYFRPSNLINPCLVDKSSQPNGVNNVGTSYDGTTLDYYAPCLNVCKKYDYFTSATLSPQFGGSVSLPLGTYAPLAVLGSPNDSSSYYSFKKLGTTTPTLPGFSTSGSSLTAGEHLLSVYTANGAPWGSLNLRDNVASSNTLSGVSRTSIVADLTNATAATINSIRYAFQVQKYLERSNYGSRYFEILNAHYGTTSPDGRLQRPDRLGYHKFYINVSQVLATATSTDGSASSNLGQTGAVSVTGDKVHLFDAAFTEPGYLYVLLDTKFDRSYSGGILREDKRKYRLEFYSPEFANLGDQPIYKNELALYDDFAGTGFVGFKIPDTLSFL